MTGLLVLVATLVLAGVVGLVLRARNGQVRAAGTAGPAAPAAPVAPLLAELDALGIERGARLTLLQFSSTFCTPCRATRTLLTDVVRTAPDVRHVEVDVAAGDRELALVRRLDIRRTPTTVILDASGQELARASGVPRREQVLALVGPPGTPDAEGR